MEFYEPHTWLGVVGLVVVATGLIIPAWLAAKRGTKATKQGQDLLDQVRNGHDTPMRIDLDRIHDDIKEILVKLVRLETRFEDHVEAHKPPGFIHQK